MLAPGTYRLNADLANPQADRRERYDWRKKAVFTAGTEFVVVVDEIDADDAKILASGSGITLPTSVRMVGARFTYQAVHCYGLCARLYAALEGALQPVAESVAAFASRLEVRDHFATWLLYSGVVTRELFERLWLLYSEDSTDSALRLVERP
jgi:hypothetical protein